MEGVRLARGLFGVKVERQIWTKGADLAEQFRLSSPRNEEPGVSN